MKQESLFDAPIQDSRESQDFISKKARFLRVLQGKSQKYKRYTKSPLRYGRI